MKRKTKIFKFLLIFIIFIVTGCSSARIGEKERNQRRTKITSFYREWKGTRYRLGGTTKSGIDCSALMQILYKERFKKDIPRTTVKIAEKGEKVKKREHWEVGDLVFFRIGRKKTHHVGVYLGDNKFLHASTTRGVMISEIDGYWNRYFWQTRKIM